MNHLRDALAELSTGRLPVREQLELAFEDLLEPETPPVLVSAFLTALRMKGESATVLEMAVKIVIRKSVEFATSAELGPVRLDTCGTGGDGAASINISTASAFVVASAGVPVVKHGNRSATGRSGSSDVLDSLGIRVNQSVEKLKQLYHQLHFVFLSAPDFHPALKWIAPIRKQLPFRTIFNLVGPLANPARPTHQLLGVADQSLAKLFAHVLQKRQVMRTAIISAHDGLDEISTGSPTRVLLVTPDSMEDLLWHPGLTFGMRIMDSSGLRVESAAESARRILAVFEDKPEKSVDEAAIVMNSAAALWVAGQVDSPLEGIEMAREAIGSGAALRLLENYRTLGN
jgi:anthranilate phosphoribosyltransferase